MNTENTKVLEEKEETGKEKQEIILICKYR